MMSGSCSTGGDLKQPNKPPPLLLLLLLLPLLLGLLLDCRADDTDERKGPGQGTCVSNVRAGSGAVCGLVGTAGMAFHLMLNQFLAACLVCYPPPRPRGAVNRQTFKAAAGNCGGEAAGVAGGATSAKMMLTSSDLQAPPLRPPHPWPMLLWRCLIGSSLW